jgi:hypothetical protein
VYQHIAMACSPITTDALHSTQFSTLSVGIRGRYGSFPTSAPSIPLFEAANLPDLPRPL